jgi:hypothetical protein
MAVPYNLSLTKTVSPRRERAFENISLSSRMTTCNVEEINSNLLT